LEKQSLVGAHTHWTVRSISELNNELTTCYRLPIDIASKGERTGVALYFLQTGERSDVVSWQVLDPRAIEEDAERTAD